MGRELPTNLVRRGARIWVRIAVPRDVRNAYGKAGVFESTGHDDDKKGRAAGLTLDHRLTYDGQAYEIRDLAEVGRRRGLTITARRLGL